MLLGRPAEARAARPIGRRRLAVPVHLVWFAGADLRVFLGLNVVVFVVEVVLALQPLVFLRQLSSSLPSPLPSASRLLFCELPPKSTS